MERRLPIYELVDGAVRGLEDGRGAPHSGGGHSAGDPHGWHPSTRDQPLGDKNAPDAEFIGLVRIVLVCQVIPSFVHSC